MKYISLPIYIISVLSLFLLGCTASMAQEEDASMAQEEDVGKKLKVVWQPLANGVWKIQVGKKMSYTPTKALAIQPKLEAINQLAKVKSFPLSKSSIVAIKMQNRITISLPLQKDEHIYGLGLQYRRNSLRNREIYIQRVDHHKSGGTRYNGHTHAPVPFYVSSKNYGIFVNTARAATFYVGTATRKDSKKKPPIIDRNVGRGWTDKPQTYNIEILVPEEGAEIILFSGTKMLDIVQKYNLYNGGGYIPPKWGLGFTYRTHTLYTADKVLKEIKEFKRRDFPLHNVGLEPGWMSASYPCTYDWDKKRFPNPKDFLQKVEAEGVKLNVWINPGIAPTSSIYKKMLPYSGSHLEWGGLVPDYTLKEARKVFTDLFDKYIKMGLTGLKIDEVDGVSYWLWPDAAIFPSGRDGEQMRQTYGILMQKMALDLFKKNNVRTYGMVRASYIGASQLPFAIYNDNYNFDNYVTGISDASFAGVTWTPEVRNSNVKEDWLRRFQLISFSPVALMNAWSSKKLPWKYPDMVPPIKEALGLRMRLLPYLYSAFYEYYSYGTPVFKAMQLYDRGYDRGMGGLQDQYLMGSSIIVAPLKKGNSRKITFPKGKWYDFYTGKLVIDNGSNRSKRIKYDMQENKMPLFVRDGAIIPMVKDAKNAINGKNQSLLIRHYGQKPGQFLLYDDDGTTYNFESKQEFSSHELKVENKNGKLMTTVTLKKGKALDTYNFDNIEWKLNFSN